MSIQFFLDGIISGSSYALIALGFTIIYRTVKFFHFAHGIIYTISAYFAFSLAYILKINLFFSILLSISMAALIGAAIDRFIYFPLRKKNAPNLIFLLASFGVFLFIQNLIQIIYGTRILTLRTGDIRVGHFLFGGVITNNQIYILLASFLVMGILLIFLKKIRLGKAMQAIADDYLGGNVVGINSEKILIVSFILGSSLAAIAGILISFETDIEPTMGFIAILKGIIASIIGGIGSIPGAILGGFFLGLAESLGIWKLPAEWKDSIAFIILIIFLLIRPVGILGKKAQKDII